MQAETRFHLNICSWRPLLPSSPCCFVPLVERCLSRPRRGGRVLPAHLERATHRSSRAGVVRARGSPLARLRFRDAPVASSVAGPAGDEYPARKERRMNAWPFSALPADVSVPLEPSVALHPARSNHPIRSRSPGGALRPHGSTRLRATMVADAAR